MRNKIIEIRTGLFLKRAVCVREMVFVQSVPVCPSGTAPSHSPAPLHPSHSSSTWRLSEALSRIIPKSTKSRGDCQPLSYRCVGLEGSAYEFNNPYIAMDVLSTQVLPVGHDDENVAQQLQMQTLQQSTTRWRPACEEARGTIKPHCPRACAAAPLASHPPAPSELAEYHYRETVASSAVRSLFAIFL
jgi:hypothetical protein